MKPRSINNIFILCISASALMGCNTDEQRKTHPEITQKEVNNGLINSHKEYLLQQEDEIKQYVARHNYDMQKTASGIYYKINEHGKGELAKVGEFASVSYTISLLDGTVCYDTKNEGPKQFKVGEDEVESGVHEAVQLMHVGDEATFIIPSNLANGLVGDKDKIPPGAIVIYNINLLSVTHTTSSLAK
ncbi:MAG TPA: FKBP-type peptidyl-prolyl cis-trans isomerase [Bacteroidia bacterium]|jgi:FKBP-type peptidyl-prolyl cis-trans isomerase|nr:FKBP-type peptidyl-prolyl cis-trans isomerase [Bacteroidia bacterium]